MSVCVSLPCKVINSPTHRQVIHRPAQVVRAPGSVRAAPPHRSVCAPSSLPVAVSPQTLILSPDQIRGSTAVISSPKSLPAVLPTQTVQLPTGQSCSLPSTVSSVNSLPAVLTTQTVTLSSGHLCSSPSILSSPNCLPTVLTPQTLILSPEQLGSPVSLTASQSSPTFTTPGTSSPEQPCSPLSSLALPDLESGASASRPKQVSSKNYIPRASQVCNLRQGRSKPEMTETVCTTVEHSPKASQPPTSSQACQKARTKQNVCSAVEHSPKVVNSGQTLNKSKHKQTVCSTAEHSPKTSQVSNSIPARQKSKTSKSCLANDKQQPKQTVCSTAEHQVAATKCLGQDISAQTLPVTCSPDAPPVYCTTALKQVGAVQPQAGDAGNTQVTHTSTHVIPAVNPHRKFSVSVQRLDLQRNNADDPEPVRGQIVISLISRDRGNAGTGPAVTNSTHISNNIPADPNELPEG